MHTSNISNQGRVTIPAAIRRYAHLEAGTSVEFHVNKDGSILITPVTKDIRELKGIVKAPKKPVSLRAMKSAIGKSISKKVQC